MKQIFIIEHLEPELREWCLIEYEHISKILGKSNIWFTNIKNTKDAKKLIKFGSVFQKSVKKMNLKQACLLDPEARKTLSPKDRKYKYFIFGGILGDYPPRRRTQQELTKFLPKTAKRNLGKMQMSTDNAVYTVKKIIKGTPLNKLKFRDDIEIIINEIESTQLPFRYNIVNKKPLLSKKLISYLKGT